MKTFHLYFTLIFLFFYSQKNFSQVSFTLNPAQCEGNFAIATANLGTMSAMGYSWTATPQGVIFSTPGTSATSISFATTGTFTITLGVLTSNGFSYATNTVVVNPIPLITVTASADTICAPQTVTLNVTGATNYTWVGTALSATNAAMVTASPSTTIVYSIIGESLGCFNSATYKIFVGSFPSGSGIGATSSAVCPGQTAVLTSSNALHYKWTSDTFTGSISQQSITAAPGSYTLLLSNGGGCTNIAIFNLGVLNCTGLTESQNDNQIVLFPNPFQSELFFKGEFKKIEFYDGYGKLIISKNLNPLPNATVDVSSKDIKPGIYYVKLTDDKGRILTMKAIKE